MPEKEMEMITQTLSPEEVLAIFIEQHRLISPYDPEADPEAELSFESTVSDWRGANYLLPWGPLSVYLNKEFNLSATEKEWKAVLYPAYKRTLKDVCTFISANYPSGDPIVPKKLFGKDCLSASVFRALKKGLDRRGVDTSEIRPSSALSPYFDPYLSEMLDQITLLSKGKMVFEQFGIEVKRGDSTKKGLAKLWSYLSKIQLLVDTGEMKTFRDLTHRIIEVNTPGYYQKATLAD